MKTTIRLNKVAIILLIIITTLSSCSTWRYQHPRVKIDGSKDFNMVSVDEPKEMSETVTAQSAKVENSTSVTTEVNNQTVSTNNTLITPPVIKQEVKTIPAHSTKIKKEKKGIQYFIQQLMNNNDKKLLKVQDVEKTALSGWIRIMVILFVVGFILLLVGIFLSVFISGPFWWLFYAFGSLCILAGFVILILVLLGII